MAKRFSKLEIQCLAPAAYNIFKSIMPPVTFPCPQIYVANGRDFRKVREQALTDVSCPYKEIPAEDSIMEYIHGEKGSAILIRQNLLPDKDEKSFCWFFWHELGHWYAINSEKDDLHRYNDPELLDNISLANRLRGIDTTSLQLKQEGYWFWQEFIAEAISKYVAGKYDAEHYTKKPDHIDWNPVVWGPIVHYLDDMLDAAFSPFNSTVDEYALAHYFANLFMRDVVVLYVKAAEAGELLVNDNGKIVYPDKLVEPTCISDIDPKMFQPAMWELHKLLKRQMQKERFWEIDENYLLELGKHIKELRDVQNQLITAGDWDEEDDTSI